MVSARWGCVLFGLVSPANVQPTAVTFFLREEFLRRCILQFTEAVFYLEASIFSTP